MGLVGLGLTVVSLSAAVRYPLQGEPTPTVFNWLGLSGVVALLGWAKQWGEHMAFKQATEKELERVAASYVRLDRWDDHRAEVSRRQQEIVDRIEGLHRSLQAVRRDQLERIHGLSGKDGGV